MLRCMLLWCCCCLPAVQGSASDLPPTAYAALPTFKDIRLSPDGTKAVALQAREETYHVVLIDFEERSTRLLMASDPEEFLFDWCHFANAGRIVCRIRSYGKLVAGDLGFMRRYREPRTTFFRLLAVDIDGSNPIQLVDPVETRARQELEWNHPNQSTIVSWLPEDRNHILIQLARDHRLYPSVYRLNIRNNRIQRLQRHRDAVLRWYGNDSGELVMAAGSLGRGELLAWSLVDGTTRLDLSADDGIEPPTFLGVADDGHSVWVSGNNGENTRGIARFDLKTGKVADVLYRHPSYDVLNLVQHPKTGAPLFTRYYADQLELEFFDAALETHYRAVGEALDNPDRLDILSMDHALRRFIFRAEGNGQPIAWYFYDSKSEDLMLIARAFQDIAPLHELQYVTYSARDGTTIPAYLGVPEKGEGPWPTVILPHGGPYARDKGAYDLWAELLLDRGYAVLKPNFRGSSGFGDAFMSAGFYQYGLLMQQDVEDGLDWLIGRGVADPKRICFVGGSYGGYVALVAAYRTPQKIQCAAVFAPLTDLQEHVLRQNDYVFGRLNASYIQTDPDSRRENSPIENVQQIGVPVLLVHGDKDRNVLLEQSSEFAEAMRAAGKPITYVEQPGGDHFLSRFSHRTQWLEELDRFLAEHIGENALSSARAASESE